MFMFFEIKTQSWYFSFPFPPSNPFHHRTLTSPTFVLSQEEQEMPTKTWKSAAQLLKEVDTELDYFSSW